MDNKEDVIYSKADRSCFDELIGFHRNQFGDIRPKKVWEWQYGANNPNKSVLLIGKHDNKIVASQGAMPIDLVINGEIFPSGKNETLLIAPEFRKKGVFKDLYVFSFNEYKKAGFFCIWGFTKAEAPFKKVGFSFDRIVERSVLPLNYQTALKLAKAGKKAFLLKSGAALISLYSLFLLKTNLLFARADRNYQVLDEQITKDDLIKFYSKVQRTQKGIIHFNLTDDFLKWRIKKAPKRIITFYAYLNNELAGYLFLEIGNDYSDILDFMYLDKGAGFELMRKLHQLIKNEDIQFLAYSGNKSNLLNKRVFKFLRKFGFIKIKGPNGFVLKQFNDMKHSLKLKNWYITSLWYEGI